MFKSTSYKPVPDASTQPLNPPGSVDSQGQQKGAPQRGSNPISSKKEEKKKKKNSKNKQVPLVQKAKQVWIFLLLLGRTLAGGGRGGGERWEGPKKRKGEATEINV